MSASRERKERAQKALEQPAKKETKKKKKLSEGWILAISVILVVVVVFGAVLGIRYYQQNQTVLTAGGKDVAVKEFNYFYNSVVNNFSNYASYVGIDTATPLDEQKIQAEAVSMMSLMGMDTELLEPYAKDGGYDITWAGYFAEMAKESAVQAYTVYKAAMDAGYTMSDEVKQTIDNEILNTQLYAQIYGYDTDEFIENNFGRGCNEENYRAYLEVVNVASDYAASLTYSEAELSARYGESKEDFDVVSYLLYTAKASDFAAEDPSAEGEEATDEKETDPEALAEAKAAAEAMEKEFNAEDEKVAAYADQVRASAQTYTTDEAAAWMFETAKAGDVKLFEDAEAETYYVIKVLSNENYESINALMIYVANDTEETAEDHEGHDHEHEEGEEVELTAEKTIQIIESSLQADASEDNFRSLMEEHNDSQTSEISKASYANISNNISKQALLWAAEGQEKGAYATFESTDGTYILYFMGTDETYRDLSVTNMLISEWLDKVTEEALAVCNYDADAAMNGGVGLVLGNANG